jgi:glycosyltransferase involved in cell wall biosynthesis
MHRIALCIVSYNRRPYTERTLTPLLEQLDDPEHDLHLFVYDNASSDSTPDYLRAAAAKHDKLTVVLGDENIGVTRATRYLLEECVFGQGFDFIAKNDDDELLPDDWMGPCDYWDRFEEAGGVLVGFKRRGLDDYFSGLEWVSRRPENLTPIIAGPYIGFLSYIVPGFEMTTEAWWRRIMPHLTDFGQSLGGWDPSMAMTVRDVLGKQCLVIFNRLSIHFQRDEDYPDYTAEKEKQVSNVREAVFELRRQGALE